MDTILDTLENARRNAIFPLVEGMTRASCAGGTEKAPIRVRGVAGASVDLAAERAADRGAGVRPDRGAMPR